MHGLSVPVVRMHLLLNNLPILTKPWKKLSSGTKHFDRLLLEDRFERRDDLMSLVLSLQDETHLCETLIMTSIVPP